MDLHFNNPTLPRSGTFTTVRKGEKWYGTEETDEGVWFVDDATGESFGNGVVQFTEQFFFEDIYEGDLATSHDPNARTLDGIKKVLEDAYGEIAGDDMVTVVEVRVSRVDDKYATDPITA